MKDRSSNLLMLCVLWLVALCTPADAQVSGDFNGDGFDDLAVSAMGEDIAQKSSAGAVNIIYGGPSRLTSANNQFWHQNSPGMRDSAEVLDYFGWALATGDFDGDGFDDLAVGIPFEDVASQENCGAVQVMYGTGNGLSADRNQFWHQNSTNIPSTCYPGDNFGFSLAVGDFNNDGRDDLAIGAPYDFGPDVMVDSPSRIGVVHVLYGTANGLRAANNQIWSQATPNILGDPQDFDQFGSSLAAGDFDNDGFDDLAIGVRRDTVAGLSEAGAVNVLYGTANGLRAARNQRWHQDSPNVMEVAEAGEHFGVALAAGDFNGDGRDDLAIACNESLGPTLANAGAINVLYGSSTGITSAGNQLWHQDSPGVNGQAKQGDNFGRALAVGDFNHDGFADLLIGMSKDVDGLDSAGAFAVLHGSASRLTSTGDLFWHQNASNIPGTAAPFEYFGYAVGVGDFDGDGFDDACIGVPGDSIPIPSSQTITKITLYLGVSHEYPDDLDIMLVGPTGINSVVFADVGGSTGVQHLEITLDDAATSTLPDNGPLVAGTFRPANFEGPEFFPAPAPTPSGHSTLSVFNGTSPIGQWSLYVADDTNIKAGSLSYWGIVIKSVAGQFGSTITVPMFGAASPYPATLNITEIQYCGAVHVFYGSSNSLKKQGSQYWHQNRSGIKSTSQSNDYFGGPGFD